MFHLPKTATAPFCPSEVAGSVFVASTDSFWKKASRFAGPGLLISVGYMDPGNWATAINAGSVYGYSLLFVVVLSSLAAIVLQCLSLRLGIASGKDLAVLCRENYSPPVAFVLWILAEIAIIACDLAEVLGCALAFKLLINVSLPVGVLLTAFDTLLILGLKGQGFRKVEAIVLALILTIAGCLFTQLVFINPDWQAVLHGAIPSIDALSTRDALYLAIGILGATVMPHNLYLHSSIVQTRRVAKDEPSRREAIRFASLDTVVSLMLALLVNGAILVLAAAAFHATGNTSVTEIDQAYHLLDPIAGTAAAGILFGLGLLAAGQSSTFTGTIAGQVIMEGFLKLKIACWKRRVITRALALVPAFVGVIVLGENSVGRLLVLSQVVLSMQLPFVMYPLLRLTGRVDIMGGFVNAAWLKVLAWSLFAVISAANVWLVLQAFGLG
ncbi:MAG: manganese transport protein [Bradyrhizobium sp.]|jgi:manganese transport protein